MTILPIASGAQVRSRVGSLLRGHRWTVLGAAVALLVDSGLALVGPIAVGWITRAVVEREPVGALVGPVVLLVAAAAVGVVTTWSAAVLVARAVLPAVGVLRRETVAAALTLPVDELEAGGGGDLVARVSGDAEQLTEATQGALAGFLGATLTIVVTVGGLATLDWRLLLAGLPAVPIQASTLRWYLRTSRPVYAAGRVAEGRRTGALLIAFAALPTVRALRLGARRSDAVEEASAESMACQVRAVRIATRFYGRLNLAEFVGLGAILLTAFLLVRADAVGVGEATTAALFFATLFTPINVALGTFDTLQQASAALARMVGVVGSATPRTLAPPQASAGEVRAEDVGFGYPRGPEVLHGIDLTVPPGGHLAVVGTTGSGKSTLATLLAGLREPRTGRITVGGHPPRPGSGVALVTQEVHVFSGTVADNLRLAAPGADPAVLREALDAVGALDWVDALPDGLDTLVGAGATALPAAQAQQLALARVLLLDPPVVVLDEATAEGGSDAARALDRAATAALRGRTAVVVAHRLTHTAQADAIVVLEHGRVVERGTHAELVEAGGRYARLWGAWSRVEPL